MRGVMRCSASDVEPTDAEQLSRNLTADTLLDTLMCAATYNCPALVELCLHSMRVEWRKTYASRAVRGDPCFCVCVCVCV